MGEIFTLLVMTCIYGNNTGCINMGNAYYLTTPLPGFVEYANKEYKTFTTVVGAIGLAKERHISANIGYNFSGSLDFKSDSTVTFLKWRLEY